MASLSIPRQNQTHHHIPWGWVYYLREMGKMEPLRMLNITQLILPEKRHRGNAVGQNPPHS